MTKQFPMTKFQHPNKNSTFGYLNFGFFCILYLGIWSFFLLLSPLASAQQSSRSEDPGQEASPSQAQATMASLFGRGAKMPGIPRISGTIALPAFDSSGMVIDEDAVSETHRGERSSGNVER